jgi:hypothetical protein
MLLARWRSSFLTIGVLLLLSMAVCAQKVLDKPYEKWSREDALSIVTSSPWAFTYQSREAAAVAGAIQTARDQGDTVNSGGGGRGAGSVTRVSGFPPIVVRLHSGLPVREAITRGRQIAAGYDKMDSQKKSEFDESTKTFLTCAICSKYYVISVTKVPDSTSQSIDDGMFERSDVKTLMGGITLVNDKGEERRVEQITPSKGVGGSAYLFFPRKDDKGNLLITPDTKKFKLVFAADFFDPKNIYAPLFPRTLEFSVSKLTVDGKILF